jgi:hypothetical protein
VRPTLVGHFARITSDAAAFGPRSSFSGSPRCALLSFAHPVPWTHKKAAGIHEVLRSVMTQLVAGILAAERAVSEAAAAGLALQTVGEVADFGRYVSIDGQRLRNFGSCS